MGSIVSNYFIHNITRKSKIDDNECYFDEIGPCSSDIQFIG